MIRGTVEMANDDRVIPGFRFGSYELRFSPNELFRDGLRIKLQEKPFQVLALLVEKAGNLVTREELRNRLWPADMHVEFDANLNAALAKVRHALDESAENPRYIHTVFRLGYRFTADVEPLIGGEQITAFQSASLATAEPLAAVAAFPAFAQPSVPRLRPWLRRTLLIVAMLTMAALLGSLGVRTFASHSGQQATPSATVRK